MVCSGRKIKSMKFFDNYKAVFLFALIWKLFGVFTTGDPGLTMHHLKNGKFPEQLQSVFMVNNDEMLIAEVAINHRRGLSYMSSQECHRDGFVYNFTAFRPSYPVYLHLALQTVYEVIFPNMPIQWKKTDPYFIGFGVAIQLGSFLLFFLSLFFFRRMACIFMSPLWSNITVFLYAIHPSVSFYVGNLTNYESIVTSILIIQLSIIMRSFTNQLSRKEQVLLIVGFLAGVLFRPQVNFIYLFLFPAWILFAYLNRLAFKSAYLQARNIVLTCCILFLLTSIPVWIKNYRLFDAWTLSNSGFAFSLGHHPFARGGWCGDCFVNTEGPFYSYIRNLIPGYDQMNEYEKSSNLQKISIQWITNNPGKELILMARKIAIYFLPVNNDHDRFNVLNLVFNSGGLIFLFFLFHEALLKNKINKYFFLLSTPLVGSLMVTVFFFVGYRWRYYAEPFMVVMFMIMLQNGLSWWKMKRWAGASK